MWSDHAHPAPILDPLDATMLTLSNTAYLGTGVVAASIGLYYEAHQMGSQRGKEASDGLRQTSNVAN